VYTVLALAARPQDLHLLLALTAREFEVRERDYKLIVPEKAGNTTSLFGKFLRVFQLRELYNYLGE
jgi:hypothetical protein